MASRKDTWVTIPDSRVRLIFRDPGNHRKEVAIPPTYFEENGTPICDDTSASAGDDMEYVRTEIRR